MSTENKEKIIQCLQTKSINDIILSNILKPAVSRYIYLQMNKQINSCNEKKKVVSISSRSSFVWMTNKYNIIIKALWSA